MQQTLDDSRHAIGNGRISAIIKTDGAELCSLLDSNERQLLWQAGPAWPRHAPILFPIVGRLKGDILRHKGQTYPMTQHGFARDQRFEWREKNPQSCSLVLRDNEATRFRYPFSFELSVAYEVSDDELITVYEVHNTGDETLPASIGGHPAFNWPLVSGLRKEAHRIVFSDGETRPIRRLKDGLLLAGAFDSPIHGNRLDLSEALFSDDAMILDQLASSSLRYTASDAPTVQVSWQGFQQLGLWSKPGGAPFLCIEPWYGYASPLDFDGDFTAKPGLMHLGAGEKRRFTQRFRIQPPEAA